MFYYCLNILTHLILKNYAFQSNCVMIISNKIPNIDLKGNYPIINVRLDTKNDSQNVLTTLMNFGCQIFLFNVDNYTETLFILEEAIKKTDVRAGRRKLLFIPSDQNRAEIQEKFIQVMTLPILQFIPDVLFLLPTDNNNTKSNNGKNNVQNNNNFRNEVSQEKMTKEQQKFISTVSFDILFRYIVDILLNRRKFFR